MCSIRVAESWYRYSRRLPDMGRRTQLTFVVSCLEDAYDYFREQDDRRSMEYVESLYQAPAKELEELGGIDTDHIADIDVCAYGDDYQGWVGRNHLFMNLASQLPRAYCEWMNDDVNFKPDERSLMYMADAFCAFDHCRENMYEFYNLDEDTRYSQGRSLDMEILMDTYVRLLTVLNKLGKVMDTMYPSATGERNDFRRVTKSLLYNRNRYIRSIAYIIRDLFPEYEFNEDVRGLSKNVVESTFYSNTIICDAVIRGCVTIVPADEPPFLHGDTAAVPADYFERQVMKLMNGVREIVFMLQLSQYE